MLNTDAMVKRTVLLVFLLLVKCSHAQTENSTNINKRPLNGIGINLLGDAALISLHYDRIILAKDDFLLSAKLGIGFNEEFQLCIFGGCDPPDRYAILPHQISTNFGRNRHFFEIGVGGSVLFGNREQPYVFYPLIGYRLMPIKNNRIGFKFNCELPISSKLEGAGLGFVLGGDMPFIAIGITISYWFINSSRDKNLSSTK